MKKTTLFLVLICFLVVQTYCQDDTKGGSTVGGSNDGRGTFKTEMNFSGKTSNGYDWYNCQLKITPDDSILLVARTFKNSIYYEERGKIQQVKDSIYLIESRATFLALPLEDQTFDDKLVIHSESSLNINSLKLTYSNGTSQSITVTPPLTSISFDKKLFNSTSNYLDLDIGHLDPLTNKPVTFTARHGSAYSFSSGKTMVKYFIIIKGDTIHTLNSAPLQIGHYKFRVIGG